MAKPIMKEEGQVYTSKKTVTILAADPTPTRATLVFCDSSGAEMSLMIAADDYFFVKSEGHTFVAHEKLQAQLLDNGGVVLHSAEVELEDDPNGGVYKRGANPFTAYGSSTGAKVTAENTAVYGEVTWFPSP